jgi:hypothetical protein
MRMRGDEFDFRLDAKITRVTNQQTLDSLSAFAKLNGSRPFTRQDYDSWEDKRCNPATVSRRFGSWRRALAQIGVEIGVRPREYSARELMDNLELVWRELGRPPGQGVVARRGFRISAHAYRRRWGTLRKACVLLARFKNGEISEKQLLGSDTPRTRVKEPRSALALKVRWEVLKRDDYKCVKCGRRPPDVELQVDHIQPRSRGGKDDPSNLQTLCLPCNQGKKDR